MVSISWTITGLDFGLVALATMQFQKILIVGGAIIGFFASLWMIVCSLLEEKIPNSIQPREDYIFDYVVVGAGTAGSVVASVLSKHSKGSILLIEAGDKFGLLSKIPLLTTFQQQGLNDWSFQSVPQKFSSKSLENEQQCLPRGKGLGGSAQLNYMLHFDGQPLDFEEWSKGMNLTQWTFTKLKPFLEAGKAKPYELLTLPKEYSKITEALHLTEMEFGQKSWSFRKAIYNIKNGLRFNVWQRFLQPALQNHNIRVMTSTYARRILIDEDLYPQQIKIKGLLISFKDERTRKEKLFEIGIRRELILSAGTYQTPQILLASGFGDEALLQQPELKIAPKLHLPQIGRNLHDHLNVPLFVSIDLEGPTLNQRTLLSPINLINYLTLGSGHLGNFGVLGHIDNKQKFSLTFFGVGAVDESALMSISNFKKPDFRALFPKFFNSSQEGFVLISNCLQPKSRGVVSIKSPNTRKSPLINPNYLSKPEDIDCSIEAIQAAVEVISSQPFKQLGARLHWPKLKGCLAFGPFDRDFHVNKPSKQYLECIIRHVGLTAHHPGGTSRMGLTSEDSVVDQFLRVHGVSNLRVIDASVLPKPISGNPNSVLVGIAIRGAAMILKDEAKDS